MDLVDLPSSKLVEKRTEVHASRMRRIGKPQHLGACGDERRLGLFAGLRTDEDRAAALENLRPDGRLKPRIHDHAEREPHLIREPHRHLRIVGEHRADARHDRPRHRTPVLRVLARRRARDPLGSAVGKGRAAVERRGALHPHPGPARRHTGEKAPVGEPSLFASDAFGHLDARIADHLQTPPRHLGVRVGDRRHDAADPVLDDRKRTGRRAPPVRAWLERHVDRRALNAFSTRGSIPQSHHLGVRTARLLREAPADHPAVPHDDGADRRIGRRKPAGLRGLLKRKPHPEVVVLHATFIHSAFRHLASSASAAFLSASLRARRSAAAFFFASRAATSASCSSLNFLSTSNAPSVLPSGTAAF